MKILRINYMKIWLVSNILRNLNYRESFSRKIYFIIKAFQWRNRWSVPREMACRGGVKSTQNINIPENFMLLALPHFEPIFMAIKSNFMMRRHDWNTSPNPFRIRPGDSGGHCTATGLNWTGLCSLKFLNIFSCISAVCSVLVVRLARLLISGSNSIISHTSCWSSFYNCKLKVSLQFLLWFVKISLYLSHN